MGCEEIDNFWKKLATKLEDYHIEAPCHISPCDIILGRYKQPKHDLFNHVILYAKYFIHKQFVSNKPPIVANFMNCYKQILSIEKQRHIEKNQLGAFNIRFGKSSLVNEINL